VFVAANKLLDGANILPIQQLNSVLYSIDLFERQIFPKDDELDVSMIAWKQLIIRSTSQAGGNHEKTKIGGFEYFAPRVQRPYRDRPSAQHSAIDIQALLRTRGSI